MSKVLVLYPELFTCSSKFIRKMNRIVSKLKDVTLVFPTDSNNLISEFNACSAKEMILLEDSEWSLSDLSHAVVFDDGEEFPSEVGRIEELGIPLRHIHIAITRVINIKVESEFQACKSTEKYEYIGRGSYWGNPHSMYEEGDSREEVIRKYKYDFDYDKFPNKEKSRVNELAGKRLGCFCKPLACHGDILAGYLNSWDDGK